MVDFEYIEEFIVNRMRETRIPGLSVGIVKENELIYARGFGFRNLERGLPATPGTIYGIGSVTKSFTALSILRLAEEGRLSLEDPVDKYIQLKLRISGEPVKIHHLLTHTSGIPALGYAEAFINGALGLDSNWLPVSSADDVMVFMRGYEDWVVSRPGERFFYLNEGYVLLGHVVSKVSGIPYETYVTQHILKPLGMNRTYFNAEEVSRDSDVATPYILDRKGRHIPSRFPFGITADGGLLSNVIDMSRYITMLMNRGVLNDVRIVSKDYLELAERRYINVPWRIIGDEGYGYGLIVSENFFGRKLVQHSGNVLVYTAYMAYLPSDRLGVVIMSNAEGYSMMKMGIYILTRLVGHEPRELWAFKLEDTLRRLEGVYEAYNGTVRVSVKARGDFLVIKSSTRYTEESTILIPEEVSGDYARFYTLLYGAKVPVEFTIKGGKIYMTYERYVFIKRE
ncbi:serine hydrolase [Caldivirga maquilingensis]|uniref:Beta-lactamase n=1 Tax=Caldivirga maquilingensis (strain ATCC 700844 / DSM 13496 / JCM 10307 / IC-167) TaxID=397948 RepID=A8MA37_CALMQ|nr:serine hydrolase [Caldivirga maquilingensis]ABW00969.1 beta-lactamase [Caldivirga maquilingensis IC-167]